MCSESISSAACTPLLNVIAVTPLLVAAACGMDEGLKGRVTYSITLRPQTAERFKINETGCSEIS